MRRGGRDPRCPRGRRAGQRLVVTGEARRSTPEPTCRTSAARTRGLPRADSHQASSAWPARRCPPSPPSAGPPWGRHEPGARLRRPPRRRVGRFDTRFLQLGIHPGGGHAWMLQRIAGPQLAAAAVLFGEVLDGAEAERAGLRRGAACPAPDLLPAAATLAARAAAAPHELVARAKATLADVATIATHAEAVEREPATRCGR
ncbi:MAG: enoyl-CoA hydratase-related protein [Acidimicrobiales bacterium]